MNMRSFTVLNMLKTTIVPFFLLMSVSAQNLFSAENTTSSTESPKAATSPLDGFSPGSVPTSAEESNSEDESSKIFPTVWCAKIEDKDTESVCWKAYQNGLNYYEFGLSHRESVLKWQHLSTQIILFVVLILVAMGLYFAWVQFQNGAASQASNKIEISLEGVKVSSPVLGVIILTLSLGFFYLYLVYVYPLNEVI